MRELEKHYALDKLKSHMMRYENLERKRRIVILFVSLKGVMKAKNIFLVAPLLLVNCLSIEIGVFEYG